MKSKKVFCSQCHNLRVPYYTVEVDGVPHHCCEQCQQSQKAEFMQKLAAGDPEACRIYQAVVSIVTKGKI